MFALVTPRNPHQGGKPSAECKADSESKESLESSSLDSESTRDSVRLDSKPTLDSVFSLHSVLGFALFGVDSTGLLLQAKNQSLSFLKKLRFDKICANATSHP
ncbi:hypothetical protein [uncultured Helicobacter sp.]|uniref:hypothetical protein n=1 Tax=uncultured Helicobacter sp. TaxID=175537 RepID=UPI003751D5FA